MSLFTNSFYKDNSYLLKTAVEWDDILYGQTNGPGRFRPDEKMMLVQYIWFSRGEGRGEASSAQIREALVLLKRNYAPDPIENAELYNKLRVTEAFGDYNRYRLINDGMTLSCPPGGARAETKIPSPISAPIVAAAPPTAVVVNTAAVAAGPAATNAVARAVAAPLTLLTPPALKACGRCNTCGLTQEEREDLHPSIQADCMCQRMRPGEQAEKSLHHNAGAAQHSTRHSRSHVWDSKSTSHKGLSTRMGALSVSDSNPVGASTSLVAKAATSPLSVVRHPVASVAALASGSVSKTSADSDDENEDVDFSYMGRFRMQGDTVKMRGNTIQVIAPSAGRLKHHENADCGTCHLDKQGRLDPTLPVLETDTTFRDTAMAVDFLNESVSVPRVIVDVDGDWYKFYMNSDGTFDDTHVVSLGGVSVADINLLPRITV
jgi:hypothetical protein